TVAGEGCQGCRHVQYRRAHLRLGLHGIEIVVWLREKSGLPLILGGAVVHRCGRGACFQNRRRPRKNRPEFLHERRNSKVNAHACRAERGSYDARSSQKNPWSAWENSTFT